MSTKGGNREQVERDCGVDHVRWPLCEPVLTDSIIAPRSFSVILLVVLLVGVAALSTPAGAAPLSKDDRKCAQALGVLGFKVARTQAKLGASCVRDEALVKVLDADACILADEKGKLAKATQKTLELEAKKCLVAPPFGYAGGAVVNAASSAEADELLRDAIEVAGDLVVVDQDTDRDGAICQKKALDALDKTFLKTIQQFNKCAKKALQEAESSDELRDLCFEALELDRTDPKGKIRKAANKLTKVREKNCEGVDMAGIVPGRCVGEVGAALDACLEVRTQCHACRVLAANYDVAENCDLFDDGVNNASCGVPQGTFPITFDQQVSDGVPAVGAGNIEVPGSHDLYAFFGFAGQRIFIDEQGVSGTLFLPYEIFGPTGTSIVTDILGTAEPGVIVLPASGTYTIDVGDDGSALTGTYSFTIWAVPDDEEFAIAIGDSVSDGVPAAGAGNVEIPGARDVYTFTGTAGQKIFFDEQVISGTIFLDYEITDPTGAVMVSDGWGAAEPGAIVLPETGTYTITVGDDDDDAMGTYSFTIWDVPADESFAIAIGDSVSDGVPGVGAGNIEAPGARDVYTFSGTVGDVIFFDEQGVSGPLFLDYEIIDPTSSVLVSDGLGSAEPGLIVLPATGTYTITVGADNDDATGTYSFTIWSVPPDDMFAISIGDAVSDGIPGVGAGNIEVPGARDVYTFSGTAGEVIFLDEQVVTGPLFLDYEITDPSANVIVSDGLGSAEPGVIVLPATGTYTVTVGDDDDDAVGTYSFTIWSVPPDDLFAISIGDVVSDGVPGVGAGNIEVPGARDVYTFSGTAGDTITFDEQVVTGPLFLAYEITDPSASVLVSNSLGGSDPAPFVLPQTGTYTVTVGSDSNDAVGTYSFQITF